jgi:hypothetical protein
MTKDSHSAPPLPTTPAPKTRGSTGRDVALGCLLTPALFIGCVIVIPMFVMFADLLVSRVSHNSRLDGIAL